MKERNGQDTEQESSSDMFGALEGEAIKNHEREATRRGEAGKTGHEREDCNS